jgi:hypothetical protein
LALTLALSVVTTGALAGRRSQNGPQGQNDQGQNDQGQNDQGQRVTRHKRPTKVNRVDLVIALDTSGSMSGLINSARQKLWDIVNFVARKHKKADLRVGLLTYGSQGTEKDGYVKLRHNLTRDLDSIYDTLFGLRTSGGTEYVGRVVYRASRELRWHRGARTLRVIFVAGNESADQDRRVPVRRAVRLARGKGIFVNAIYCGSRASGEAVGWRRVASRGQGVFAAIDHNHGTVNVATPYDGKIQRLSGKLNATYVAYGRRGRRRAALQKKQDKNAARTHAAAGASRAVAKASRLYRNDHWDLVDARKAGKLKRVRKDALPAHLRGKSKKEIDAYLDRMEAKRSRLRKEIKKLAARRKAYIKKQIARRGLKTDRAFDAALAAGL